MSELIQSLKNKVPNHSKAVEWIKLISITGSAQIFIQFINLLSGILIIRLLPVKEYALYTLANAMLGTMTVLADGGISTGVLSQGGKIWNDKKKLGSVIVTGLALRKKFAIVSLIIATPILAYLLKHNGASWLTTILIICALVPAFFAALSDSLLEVAPKLHQNISALQKNQILASLSRFIIISSSLILFPFTFIALLGNGITRMWANIRLRRISSRHADYEQDFDPKIEKEIITIVKRSVPDKSLSG
jgi:O-antigen/teichoic acid export membrane protein